MLWCEGLATKDGNTMANARAKLLGYMAEINPQCLHLELDGDGCVAQNRNQKEAAAEAYFLEHGKHKIQTITTKFGIPGHSPVQKVDQVHSAIEKMLQGQDVHSPLHLRSKIVNHVSPTFGKFEVINLVQGDFKDYSHLAGQMNFKGFKFSEVKVIQYRRGDRNLYFKTEHGQDHFQVHKYQEADFEIPSIKQKNVEKCYEFLPLNDQLYFKELFSVNENRKLAIKIAEGNLILILFKVIKITIKFN